MGFTDVVICEHRLLLRGKHYCVATPRRPVRKLFTTAQANADWQIWGDKSGFTELAKLTMLVAAYPEVILYIPKTGDSVDFCIEMGAPHDLVIANHQVQLRPSHWKEIRKRLGKGSLATKSVGGVGREIARPAFYKRRTTDPVDIVEHSNTVFIVSSKPTLAYLASEFHNLSACVATGDHSHLFSLMRHGGGDCREDLTMAFAAPENWVATS